MDDPALARALACQGHFPFPALGRLDGRDARVGLDESYDLKAIDGREWYLGFAHLLVEAQQPDGRWRLSRAAPIDTCFALLILRRGNLLPDLTATIQGKTPAKPPRLDFETSTAPRARPFPSGPRPGLRPSGRAALRP